MYAATVPLFKLSEAARLLDVSYDTVRRWAEAGRITTLQDARGHHVVDGGELARFARSIAHAQQPRNRGGVPQSARNRFDGIVTSVTADAVMAQVEIQAGPHRVVSLMSREACDELGLQPGVLATAVVKATNVVVEAPLHGAAGHQEPQRAAR